MALQWLIDGNNLLHQVPSLKTSAPRHAIAPLAQLAELIDAYCRRQNRRAHLLFDGPARKLPGSYARISVSFSNERTADEKIIRRLNQKGASKRWIVISDDREILAAAQKSGVTHQKATHFGRRITGSSPDGPSKPAAKTPEKRSDYKVSDQEVDRMLLLLKLREEDDN